MRRLISMLCLCTVVAVNVGCDPEYFEEYHVVNNTDSELKLSLLDTTVFLYRSYRDGIVVPAKDTTTILIANNLGTTSEMQIVEHLKSSLYGDSIMFSFFDGDTLKYTSIDTLEGPYDFENSMYNVIEYRPGYSCLTYIVNDSVK